VECLGFEIRHLYITIHYPYQLSHARREEYVTLYKTVLIVHFFLPWDLNYFNNWTPGLLIIYN